jgi:hypothetical protein
MNTVGILLSIVVNHGWTLSQMNVENAFMHGDLQEEIYMEIPSGHPNICDPNLVCKLHIHLRIEIISLCLVC